MYIEYGQGYSCGEFLHCCIENIKGKHEEMVKEFGREIFQFNNGGKESFSSSP